MQRILRHSDSSPSHERDGDDSAALSSDARLRLRLSRGRILTVTPNLVGLLGWQPEEWLQHGVEEFLHPEGLGGLDLPLAGVGQGQRLLWRDRLRSRDGRWHWVQLEVTPGSQADGDGVDAVAQLQLLEPRQEQPSTELLQQLRCDELTDLLTRREVLRRLERLQAEERRRGQEIAILFCDLDDFKAINDRWGHHCGDEVLRLLAQRLRHSLRITDLAARIGGDELLVVLNGVRDLNDAQQIAEALRQAMVQPLELPGGVVIVPTLSIGVTLARPQELTIQLIDRADQAMYRAKRNGRNQVMAIAA